MNKKITLSVKDLELWFDNDYGAVKILNKSALIFTRVRHWASSENPAAERA